MDALTKKSSSSFEDTVVDSEQGIGMVWPTSLSPSGEYHSGPLFVGYLVVREAFDRLWNGIPCVIMEDVGDMGKEMKIPGMKCVGSIISDLKSRISITRAIWGEQVIRKPKPLSDYCIYHQFSPSVVGIHLTSRRSTIGYEHTAIVYVDKTPEVVYLSKIYHRGGKLCVQLDEKNAIFLGRRKTTSIYNGKALTVMGVEKIVCSLIGEKGEDIGMFYPFPPEEPQGKE